MNKKRFFFHYNKPASKLAGRPKLSLHYNKTCHIINALQCNSPIESHNQKRQPHCIMRGFAKEIKIDNNNGIAYIN